MGALTRRGFTLVELLIGIIIFGIVGASIFGLLTRTQRLARTQADRAVMQGNIRAGLALITSELRDLNISATTSDITSLSGTAMTYRGMRSLGFICDKAAGYVRIARSTFNAYRDPIATRDAALLFVENDPDLSSDDSWMNRAISSVAIENCTSGAAGIRLNFATSIPASSPDSLAMITVGSPVRTYEVMEVGALVSSGQTWLGARSVSAGETTLSPVLGPLAAGGVAFVYRNAAGSTGASATTVRLIQITLTGITDNIVAAQAGTGAWTRATDQLITTIRVRNAP